MLFAKVEDVTRWYENTIVRLNGRAIFIRECFKEDGKYKFNVSYLRDKAMVFAVRIDDPDLNLEPVPLGFVNSGNSVTFVVRNAVRKWKHGCHIPDLQVSFDAVNLSSKLTSLANCIENKYPSYAEAAQHGRKAFHRYFAVIDGHLYYRNARVAEIVNGTPKFFERFSFIEPIFKREVEKDVHQ